MPRDLPPRLHFKDHGYYYVYRNKWTYVSDTRLGALRRYIDTFADSEDLRRAAAALMNDPKELRRYTSESYRRAKKNAVTRQIEFRLTRADYAEIVARAAGRCEVSGIAFDLQLRPRSLRRPFAPSLDRIKAHEPYTVENCRLVCGLVNAAMSDWGEEPFRFVATKMAERAGWYEPDE
jgi:hypothetical protein